MSYMTDQLLGDNQRLQDRIEELEAAQDTINSVAVHQQTLRIAELQAEVARRDRNIDMMEQRLLEQQAEVERLNKRHEKFLDEFWKTNTENERLRKALQLFDPGLNSLDCAALEDSDERK